MAAEASAPWRVLVVDDNPLIRDSVVFAVQRLNERLQPDSRKLQLYEAEDGATAWDRIVDEKIDLVIADLYIPVMTGLRLIEKIRETPETAATKILAISASIEDARVASLGAGADLFLQKPIRLVDLMDALTNLLKLAAK
jgi:CheY-like chemotaxis protein